METGPRFDSYAWAGGREPMLRFGPTDGPVVVLALPLFEEANRTRAFGVAILRALAVRGIGGVLPELPGQGESERAIANLSVLDLQSAYDAAVEQAGLNFVGYGVGLRSGTLLDALGQLSGRWHFAPQTGPELLRELRRLKEVATEKRLSDLWYVNDDAPEGEPIEVAGNLIGTRLLTDLLVKEPFDQSGVPRRVVRLASDPRPADRHVDAAPLWRRAEPDTDAELGELLAADIAAWIATCES